MHRRHAPPQVVAHRGSSEAHAEHTLGAYVQALDEGAEALECDVRLTADGHLVCVHDRKVDRTTNARGLVSTMTLEQLDELDASEWKKPWAGLDDEAEEPDRDHNKVLTLRRLLEVVRDYDRRVEVAVETKHPTRYGGLVERRLASVLDEFGWTKAGSPARMMSFSSTALSRMERLAPELDLVLLMEHAVTWQVFRASLKPGWIAGPGVEVLAEKPKLRRRLHKSGHRIHVWVVNTPAQLELCLELGVEAVITDRPGRILSLLEQG